MKTQITIIDRDMVPVAIESPDYDNSTSFPPWLTGALETHQQSLGNSRPDPELMYHISEKNLKVGLVEMTMSNGERRVVIFQVKFLTE